MTSKLKDELARIILLQSHQVQVADTHDPEINDINDRGQSFTACLASSNKDLMGDILEIKAMVTSEYRKRPILNEFHKFDRPPVRKI